MFAANANGSGVPAGVVLIRTENALDKYVPIAEFDPQTGSFVPRPIDLGSPLNNYFLILFGTGFRSRNSLDGVKVQIGGLDGQVIYAGAQSDFAGLDQLNVTLPRSLSGRGEVEVTFTVEDKTANTLLIKTQ